MYNNINKLWWYDITVDSLSQNNLSEDDAQTLSEILKVHTKLKDLKLVFNVDVITAFVHKLFFIFVVLEAIHLVILGPKSLQKVLSIVLNFKNLSKEKLLVLYMAIIID